MINFQTTYKESNQIKVINFSVLTNLQNVILVKFS